ncbi:MAG: hypothetical protein ACR2RF_25455 [Geminicoccaceae bacterium]
MSVLTRVPGFVRRFGEVARLSKRDIGVPLRGHLDGYVMQNGPVDTDNDIRFHSGQCSDSTNKVIMTSTSNVVKQIDAPWAAGNDAGGFPTGITLTASTWYHTFVLGAGNRRDVDMGFDSAITASNLLTSASGYDVFRRVGSVKVGGATTILGFTQIGNRFLWDTPILDISLINTLGSTARLDEISTPPDVKADAILNVFTNDAAVPYAVYISNPGTTDVDVVASGVPGGNAGGANSFDTTQVIVSTNNNSRIRSRANATIDQYHVNTVGWIDPRGVSST